MPPIATDAGTPDRSLDALLVMQYGQWAAQVQALTQSDTVLTVLPLFHVGGLCIQTLPALSVGATLLLHARFDASATLTALEIEHPTLTLQVPATLKALCKHPRLATTDLGALRAVWAGSSILPPGPVTAFHARGGRCAGVQRVRQHRDRSFFHCIAAGTRHEPRGFLWLACTGVGSPPV